MKAAATFATYVAVGVGMAIAASSFAVLSALCGVVGAKASLLPILIAGVLLLVVAGSIGSLASLYPSAPGMVVYLNKAFGRRASLTLVLLYLSVVACVGGVESYVFARVLEKLAPTWSSPTLAAAAVLITVTIVNLVGLELPERIQNITTTLLIFIILATSVLCLFAAPLPLPPLAPASAAGPTLSGSALVTATGMAVFLFLGFEWVVPLGKRPKDYERLLPLSMLVSVIVLVILYGAFAAALARHFSNDQIAATAIPQFLLATVLSSRLGVPLATLVSLLAMVTSFNAGMMGAARLIYALARQGSLPRFCAVISERSGAPAGAILTIGSLAIVAAIVTTRFELSIVMSAYAAAIECVIYGAIMFAWLRLGRTVRDGKLFRSPIPRLIQIAVAALMPLLGIAALLADEQHIRGAIATFCIAVVAITLLTHWLLILKQQREQGERLAA